jgi:hypothetical protein
MREVNHALFVLHEMEFGIRRIDIGALIDRLLPLSIHILLRTPNIKTAVTTCALRPSDSSTFQFSGFAPI